MKKYSISFLLLLAFASVFAVAGWQKKVKCANKLFEKRYLQDAIAGYNSAIQKAPADSLYPIKLQLGKCYELTGNFIKAEEIYASLVNDKNATSDVRFAYARALEANGKYNSAKFNFAGVNEAPAKDFTAVTTKVVNNNFDNVDFTLQRLSFNTNGAEYGAVFYKKGIVFTSDRWNERSPRRSAWNNEPLTDLFLATEDVAGNVFKVQRFSDQINTSLNEGTATFNGNGEEIIFSRNNTHCAKYRNKLVLVTATKEEGGWSSPARLAFDSVQYNYTHPALSPDGKTLYFASDMAGGYGGMDLYTSKRDSNTWSTPVNMGSGINTAANELFPYMAASGTLYFASNGHAGIGGLDVFSAKSIDGKMEVKNMKMPVNSSKDDFAFVIDEENGLGYLSSNRSGDDDIFSFHVPVTKAVPVDDEKPKFNQLKVVDKGNGKPVAQAKVEIFNGSTRTGKFYFTDSLGMISYEFTPGKETVILTEADGFDNNVFKGERYAAKQTYPIELSIQKLPAAGEVVYSNNLYYETDETGVNTDRLQILQEVVNKIKTSKHTKIVINGYADESGNTNYNYGLSLKRAKTIEQYLVDQMININDIQTNFYGGIQLTKECRKDKKCFAEVNKQNRRVEVKIVTF